MVRARKTFEDWDGLHMVMGGAISFVWVEVRGGGEKQRKRSKV
jgi:hypothetical protein